MAKAGEEQNTQQPTGGKGTRFLTKKQKISQGKLPKQKEARGISVHEKVKTMDEAGPSIASRKGKRGRPSSGLSAQDKKKRHNVHCQRYRKNKKDENLRLQIIEKRQNDFFEKFEISSVEHLEDEFSRFQRREMEFKTLCEKLGVTEECLEAEFRRFQQTEIKLNALCERFGVAQEGLEDEFRRFKQTEIKLKNLCEKLGVTEECLEDEFSRFQQTEIKLKTLCEKLGVTEVGLEALDASCEKFGVAQEGLEDKKKRSFCKELEKVVQILEDEPIEASSSYEDDEKFKEILKEFIVLLDGPVPRGEEATRNEHINQHAEIG